MAVSIFTQIALVVAGIAILLVGLVGVSRGLKGWVIEIAIVVAAALIIAVVSRLMP